MKQHAHSASGGARLVWKDARTLTDILRRRAAEQGSAPAFTFLGAEAGADVTVSYGELERRARAIAMELEARGLCGQRVLVALPLGPASVASLFGCLYAGAIAVPVPPPLFEPPGKCPGLRGTLAQDSGAAAALVGGQPAAEGQRLTLEGLAGHIDLIAAEALAPAPAGSDWTPPLLDPRALAFLQYTAGSTGTPKGVRVTHASLLDNVEALRRGLGHTPTDKLLLWLPTHQGLGLLEGVLQPLYAGIHAVLMPPQAFFERPVRWLEALSAHGATVSGAPDFAYELCVRTVSEAERARLELSRWRVAFTSGEQIRAETLERFAAHFAPCGFQRKAFRPVYGLAESAYLVACGRSEQGPTLRGVPVDALAQQLITERPGAASRLVSCGPAASVQVIIVNPTTRALRGEQEIGEVWLAGLSVADGYWGRVGTTEETFRGRLASASTSGRAFLRTGDLGACAGGELYVTGRVRDVIIWQGQDLRLHDLEFDVEASHPALVPGGCAAFALREGREERLVIVAESFLPEEGPAGAREALLGQIARAIRQHVSQRQGVTPEEILLLRSYRLPRASTGRVSRDAVRAAYAGSGLEPLLRARGEEPAAGAARPEPSALAAPSEKAGPGGALAELASTQELLPLTPALYAAHDPTRALSSGGGASRLFELPEGTEALHVGEALQAVWAAHETLRLRYTRLGDSGEWAAVLAPEKWAVPLAWLELASQPDEVCLSTAESTARRLAEDVGQCTGPLVTFVFCERGPRRAPWLLTVCHPALVDESSWRILATDLWDACAQARTRGRVRLAPQSGSLTQWARQLLAEAQLPRLAPEARVHWLARQLSPVLPERARASRAPVALAPGAQATVEAAALQQAAARFDVSREALLLAACALAYGTQARRSSVRASFGQSARSTSRYPVDASRMLGNLHYAFPVLLPMDPEATPEELARHAHIELSDAPLGGLAYEALRAHGTDRALAEALAALPSPDFSLHLEDEGAPSSRGALRTLAVFEQEPWPGAGDAPLCVQARLSAERLVLCWRGATADGELLGALATLTEQTLRALCAQADGARAAAPAVRGASRAPSAQRSR